MGHKGWKLFSPIIKKLYCDKCDKLLTYQKYFKNRCGVCGARLKLIKIKQNGKLKTNGN